MKSTAELIQALNQGDLTFDQALLGHFRHKHIEPITMELHLTCMLAISWAALGMANLALDLPDGQKTVAQIIKEYGLEPFLEEGE